MDKKFSRNIKQQQEHKRQQQPGRANQREQIGRLH